MVDHILYSEDAIVQAKKLLQESPSERFWKYMREHNVLEIFQPALTLLYQMPIKPDNIYEFLAEFLENGAVDLLKISQLKSELCFKHDELEELHRVHPDGWGTEENHESPTDSASSIHLRTMSMLEPKDKRKSFRESLNTNDSDLFSFPLNDDEDFDKIEHNLKLRKTESLFPEKIFKLSDFEGSQTYLGSVFGRKQGNITKIEPKEESTLKTESTEKINSKDTAEVVEIKSGDDEHEDITTKPEPVTHLHPFETRQFKRISHLVSGIQDSDDRNAMENVLNMIADHKRMDPLGILFDFSRRNAEREYELELYACGAPEAYLKKLSENELFEDQITVSDIQSLDHGAGGDAYEGAVGGEERENENEAEEGGDMEEMEIQEENEPKEIMEMDNDDEYDAELTNERNEHEDIRNISSSEARKLLHDQNRLRLIRDGLQFMHDVRKIKSKHHHKDHQRRRSQKLSSITPQSFLEDYSDSDSVLSDDNLERKRTELLLRSLKDSYGEFVSTEIKSGDQPASLEHKFHQTPTIVIHYTDNNNEIVFVPENQVEPSLNSSGISIFPIRKRLKHQQLGTMIGELFEEYRHYLEQSQTQNMNPIRSPLYSSESPQEYARKIENRFQTLMKEKRDETLIGIYRRLLKILKKERKYHLQRIMKKSERCKRAVAKYEGYSDSNAEVEDEHAYLLPKIKGDNGLKNLEATQHWIDRTFKESWKWGPRRPCQSDKIDSTEDRSESWTDICALAHHDDHVANKPNSLKPRIVTTKTAETSNSNTRTDLSCENTESLNALLNIYTRPKPNVVSYLKRSEWSRKYVEKTFNPELKDKLLKHFPFEMFDED